MVCSVISILELLSECRNLQEQQTTLKNFSGIEILHIESGDSLDALRWYQALHLSQGIGFLDCFIAAAATRLDCVLHTLNLKHFRVIAGLQVKRPY